MELKYRAFFPQVVRTFSREIQPRLIGRGVELSHRNWTIRNENPITELVVVSISASPSLWGEVGDQPPVLHCPVTHVVNGHLHLTGPITDLSVHPRTQRHSLQA